MKRFFNKIIIYLKEVPNLIKVGNTYKLKTITRIINQLYLIAQIIDKFYKIKNLIIRAIEIFYKNIIINIRYKSLFILGTL